MNNTMYRRNTLDEKQVFIAIILLMTLMSLIFTGIALLNTYVIYKTPTIDLLKEKNAVVVILKDNTQGINEVEHALETSNISAEVINPNDINSINSEPEIVQEPVIEISSESNISDVYIDSKLSSMSTELFSLGTETMTEQFQEQTSDSSTSEIVEEEIIEEDPIVEYEYVPATRYDDLMEFNPITVEQMNSYIDKFDNIVSGGTPFKGHGDVFIKASEITGYNPLYIFAHASLESAYGNSNQARTKGNYFGINAHDSNPSDAYHMGDTMEDGIINGAIWIKENFYEYKDGQTTLHDMIHKYNNHFYASAGDAWINQIISIMNRFPIE